jgi:glutamine synthetase
MAPQTPKDVLKFAKDNKVEAVDLKFCDLLGTWQHFTIATTGLSEELFEEGSGLDGSSIRGWQPINASDMLVIPDPATRSLTVDETRTSLGPASDATRGPKCTASPATSSPRTSMSPACARDCRGSRCVS